MATAESHLQTTKWNSHSEAFNSNGECQSTLSSMQHTQAQRSRASRNSACLSPLDESLPTSFPKNASSIPTHSPYPPGKESINKREDSRSVPATTPATTTQNDLEAFKLLLMSCNFTGNARIGGVNKEQAKVHIGDVFRGHPSSLAGYESSNKKGSLTLDDALPAVRPNICFGGINEGEVEYKMGNQYKKEIYGQNQMYVNVDAKDDGEDDIRESESVGSGSTDCTAV